MAAAPFVQVVNGILTRFGKALRGFMFNWYGLVHSALTLAQYRVIAAVGASIGLIGWRIWGAFNRDGLNASNTTGNFFYFNPAGNNLLSNPNFDSNSNGWQLGDDFTRVSDGNIHSGSHSIKQVSASGFDNFTTTNDATGIDVQPNTDYVFWVYAKVAITSGLGPMIEVNKDSAYGTNLGTFGSLLSTGGIFRKIGFTFNSGSATKVWIRIYNNNGNVTCYYDDFYLAKKGGSIVPIEATFQALDRCVAAFGEYGIVAKVPFMDNWGGQKEFIIECADKIYGVTGMQGGDTAAWEFFTRTEYINLWHSSVAGVLATRINTVTGVAYVNCPDWWPEIGNELRYNNPTDTNQNQATSSNFTTMGKTGGWIDTQLQYFQALFPNHQVCSTDLWHSWRWYENDPVRGGTQPYGVDTATTGALTANKTTPGHIYPSEDSPDYRLKAYSQYLTSNASAGRTEENFHRTVADFINTAIANNTAPIIDEVGIDKRATVVTGYPFYPRWEAIGKLATYAFSLGLAILDLWHGTVVSFFDDGNYNWSVDGTAHTGGNANSNLNDDDTPGIRLISRITRALNRQTEPVATLTQITPTKATSLTQITPTKIS